MFPLIPPFTQISAFWSIWVPLSLKFQHFDRLDIWHSNLNNLINLPFTPKFQHFDWFLTFHLNSNILKFPPLHPNFKILFDTHLCNKFQHLINLPFYAQISRFWSIPTFTFKFQHFDWSLPFYSNFNILIDLKISTPISTFWSIPNFFCAQMQWRSQGLPGWTTRPPRGPKWGRKWVKFEEK